MLLVIIRTVILFTLVAIGLRLTGKREIGKLQPYELVIVILLSELAVIPMSDIAIPLLNGIIPIVTLVIFQLMLSYISLKSEKFRGIVCGTPSVLIENGHILEEEMINQRYNINDLLEELRSKNIFNIADVEFAILETSGHLSVIPKSQKRPLTPKDMKIPTKYEGLPVTLIISGTVLHSNLKKIKLDEDWLKKELSYFGVQNLKQVLFASIDTSGNLFYQLENKKGMKI